MDKKEKNLIFNFTLLPNLNFARFLVTFAIKLLYYDCSCVSPFEYQNGKGLFKIHAIADSRMLSHDSAGSLDKKNPFIFRLLATEMLSDGLPAVFLNS